MVEQRPFKPLAVGSSPTPFIKTTDALDSPKSRGIMTAVVVRPSLQAILAQR